MECDPMISSLTRLEFSSSVAKKFRAGTFTQAEAGRIVSEFQAHIREGIFEVVPIHETHYALANDWMDTFATSLRALDAVHLSLAHTHKATLVTADAVLAKAARTLGVDVKKL
jgi:predicted nucleic acid-binding protein